MYGSFSCYAPSSALGESLVVQTENMNKRELDDAILLLHVLTHVHPELNKWISIASAQTDYINPTQHVPYFSYERNDVFVLVCS